MAHATWPLFLPLPRTTSTAVCSLSNLLLATFRQHLASHPTSAPLLTTSLPLPSPLTVTSHQDQKGLIPLLARLLVFIHDAFLTTYALLPSHLSEDSSRIPQALSYSSDHPKLWIFLLQKWSFATNIISTASTLHQRCQHPTKGALLLAQAKRTRNISGTFSYRHSSSPSHDLHSVTRPTPHKTVLGNLTTC